jgi:hypothetical protein
VVLAMLIVSARLPASTCILLNSASETACQPHCCANKTCCATSEKHTAPATQPVAKSVSTNEWNAAPADVSSLMIVDCEVESHHATHPSIQLTAHSPPRLALLCTFLI